MLLPGVIGAEEFVFRARACFRGWRTKALPEDADEQVTLLKA